MERDFLNKSEKREGKSSHEENQFELNPERIIARNRELNPALFGDAINSARVIEGTSQSQLPHLMQTEQKVNEIKQNISVMAEHVGKLTEQFTEFVRSNHIKMERLQQQVVRLEQNDHHIVTESTQKFSQINTRFGERKIMDNKIQEMVDRHNSVLKSFEMRLTQMQKLIMEKEAQLLTAQAAINESKMEIARLKRL